MNQFNLTSSAILTTLCALSFSAYADSDFITTYEVKRDISPPIRNFPQQTEQERINEQQQLIPLFPIPYSTIHADSTKERDGALQTIAPSSTQIDVKKFTGIGVGLGNYRPVGLPPDTNGVPGIDHYAQWVNTSFAVFNKHTGSVLNGFPKAGNVLWRGFGGLCEETNRGDPIVKFDQFANRWIFTQFAFQSVKTGPYFQCVAVSTSPDPAGTYYRYAYQYDAFNDYGKFALWRDAYYMSYNMFSNNNWWGPKVCAFDRAAMLRGERAAMQCKQLSVYIGPLLPADIDGKELPPVDTPEYFITFIAPNKLNLFKYKVDFKDESQSSFTGPIPIAVDNFSIACASEYGKCAAQPHTSNKLDTLSDRLMYRFAYRQFPDHAAAVVNHTVNGINNAPAIRWYEIRFSNSGIPALYQQGTYSPDKLHRFMGSIAMDKAHNIAVGFSTSSSSQYPSVAFAGRTAQDPLGSLTISQQIINGTGSQTDYPRWGDYSSMNIDPVDDCTFWYTNEYLRTNGSYNWSTVIANFKLPGCSVPT